MVYQESSLCFGKPAWLMGHAQDSCSGFVVGKQWTRSQGDLPHMDYYVNQETNILGLNNSPRKLGHMGCHLLLVFLWASLTRDMNPVSPHPRRALRAGTVFYQAGISHDENDVSPFQQQLCFTQHPFSDSLSQISRAWVRLQEGRSRLWR